HKGERAAGGDIGVGDGDQSPQIWRAERNACDRFDKEPETVAALLDCEDVVFLPNRQFVEAVDVQRRLHPQPGLTKCEWAYSGLSTRYFHHPLTLGYVLLTLTSIIAPLDGSLT